MNDITYDDLTDNLTDNLTDDLTADLTDDLIDDLTNESIDHLIEDLTNHLSEDLISDLACAISYEPAHVQIVTLILAKAKFSLWLYLLWPSLSNRLQSHKTCTRTSLTIIVQ